METHRLLALVRLSPWIPARPGSPLFNAIGRIQQELADQLNKPSLRVLLDCKNVRRMSTHAVIMIREFNKWLKPFGSRMALCRVRADIKPGQTTRVRFVPNKRGRFPFQCDVFCGSRHEDMSGELVAVD